LYYWISKVISLFQKGPILTVMQFIER
jgi:hypothetical protein